MNWDILHCKADTGALRCWHKSHQQVHKSQHIAWTDLVWWGSERTRYSRHPKDPNTLRHCNVENSCLYLKIKHQVTKDRYFNSKQIYVSLSKQESPQIGGPVRNAPLSVMPAITYSENVYAWPSIHLHVRLERKKRLNSYREISTQTRLCYCCRLEVAGDVISGRNEYQ